MNLTKFLRKNTRVLLMIFMSFLLVAFLVPSQIQGCGQQRMYDEQELGELYGETVYRQDVQRARAEMEILQRLGMLPATLDPLAYFLLTEEARQLGVRVDRDEVKEMLVAGGVTDPVLQSIQRASGMPYERIYDAIGRFMAVMRLGEMQAAGVTESLARKMVSYRDSIQEAVTEMSLIDARGLLHLVPEPTEEELLAFFEKYKAEEEGQSEEQLQFGYRLADRVKLEYLTVDPAAIERKVRVTSSEAKRFYEENRNRYVKEDPNAPPGMDGRPVQVPMTPEEALEQARQDAREIKAIEAAQRLINDMYEVANRPWRNAPRDEKGFRTPPEGEPISFAELREQHTDRFTVNYAATQLIDRNLLVQVADKFSQAALTAGRRRLRASQLAYRVKGILQEDPGDGWPVLNVGEPAPVVIAASEDMKHRSYQAYLFRVVEVAPSAPPDSIDEVRERVVQDWKHAKAYELAGEYAEKLASRAREVGLEQAVEEATELKDALTRKDEPVTPLLDSGPPTDADRYLADLEPFAPKGVTRERDFIRPKLDRTVTVPQKVFELADAPPAASGHAVAAVPQANKLKWVVVEFKELRPLYAGAFEAQLAATLRQQQRIENQRFMMTWFAPDSVVERTGFKWADAAMATP